MVAGGQRGDSGRPSVGGMDIRPAVRQASVGTAIVAMDR